MFGTGRAAVMGRESDRELCDRDPTRHIGAGARPRPTKHVRSAATASPRGRWYLAASPNAIDTLEYAYLEGAEPGGPTLEARDGFNIDGIEFKVPEDFAAVAIDWRGLVLNPGV
jgi:hypothetical protein